MGQEKAHCVAELQLSAGPGADVRDALRTLTAACRAMIQARANTIEGQVSGHAIAKKLAIPSSNVFQLIADLENAA